MTEATGIIIGAGIAFVSSALTTFLQNMIVSRKKRIIDFIEQFKSFYNLEKLYVAEISRLREKSNEESTKEKTIKEEFRNKNEEAEYCHIDLTEKKAIAFLKTL